MDYIIRYIDETDSTNRWLKDNPSERDMVVVADYQTAGRGCGTNRWESERGKNLLFSIRIHPTELNLGTIAQEGKLSANRQFHISMAISLAITDALGQYIGDLSIQWPIDIYWRNGKICGILIEHTLQGKFIKESIIGVGLNVNQQMFESDAPNPVSLWQITEQETNREELLNSILQCFKQRLCQDLKADYMTALYRRKGYHPYTDKDGVFMAEIGNVEDDGHLLLTDDSGHKRRYAFKEVQYII